MRPPESGSSSGKSFAERVTSVRDTKQRALDEEIAQKNAALARRDELESQVASILRLRAEKVQQTPEWREIIKTFEDEEFRAAIQAFWEKMSSSKTTNTIKIKHEERVKRVLGVAINPNAVFYETKVVPRYFLEAVSPSICPEGVVPFVSITLFRSDIHGWDGDIIDSNYDRFTITFDQDLGLLITHIYGSEFDLTNDDYVGESLESDCNDIRHHTKPQVVCKKTGKDAIESYEIEYGRERNCRSAILQFKGSLDAFLDYMAELVA